MGHDDAWHDLYTLLSGQTLAVLATEQEGHPYTSLVAFATTDDRRRLLFATNRSTRKYRNLQANPNVSLLVDSREHRATDFHAAMAATALGTAGECDAAEDAPLRRLFLERQPHLDSFLGSPDCALLGVEVRRYLLVRHFQEVVELTP